MHNMQGAINSSVCYLGTTYSSCSTLHTQRFTLGTLQGSYHRSSSLLLLKNICSKLSGLSEIEDTQHKTQESTLMYCDCFSSETVLVSYRSRICSTIHVAAIDWLIDWFKGRLALYTTLKKANTHTHTHLTQSTQKNKQNNNAAREDSESVVGRYRELEYSHSSEDLPSILIIKIVSIKLCFPGTQIYLCSIYLPPNPDVTYLKIPLLFYILLLLMKSSLSLLGTLPDICWSSITGNLVVLFCLLYSVTLCLNPILLRWLPVPEVTYWISFSQTVTTLSATFLRPNPINIPLPSDHYIIFLIECSSWSTKLRVI